MYQALFQVMESLKEQDRYILQELKLTTYCGDGWGEKIGK